jgi:transposase
MITVQEYLNNNKPIIPCNGKIPIIKEWDKKIFSLNDFKPENNIGLKLSEDIDVDIDSQRALPFINKYMQPCSATYGRGNKPISHLLFKGKSKFKKFFLHKDLEKYFKDLPHGATIIECRSGSDKQTIVPGSIIDGEKVQWNVYEGISPYPGDIFKDVSKVAFATALSILYPETGNRDDYTYSIACILAKHTEWKDYEIDEFIEHLSTNCNDDIRKNKGTHAYKQMINGGKMKGFNTLREIVGLDNADSLYSIFEWVGVNPPNRNLEALKKDHVYIQDSASMFNTETGLEQKKEDFNNSKLFLFPGGKKDKAFESLMKDYEFFHEKVVKGRAVLPGYDYPIAEIGHDHFYLEPGKYLNLYPGPPDEPEKGDVSDWVNSFKLIFGEKDYELVEQYFAAVIQKIFKYKLDLTPEESKKIGDIKIQWGLLIVGHEGTGKKALAMSLQKMIGRAFVDANATYEQMLSSHSEVIYNKLFIFINEVVTTGDVDKKVEISNKLKPFWTDEDSKINPKHIRPFRYWNNANGMCFSNEDNCLHLGKSSRRYGVINQKEILPLSRIVKLEKDGVFKKIYDFIKSDKTKQLFYYFLYEVEVKDWKLFNGGRAPSTNALKQMQDEGQHPIIQKLQRCLDESKEPFDEWYFTGFINLDDLLEFIREKWKTQVNEKYVKEWLKDVGFLWKNGKQTRQILKPNGSRPRVHLLKDCDWLRSRSETQLGSASLKPKYEYQKEKFDWQLSEPNFTDADKIFSENTFTQYLIKRLIGNQWDWKKEYAFYEELFSLAVQNNAFLYALSNKCKIKGSGGAGGEDRVDWELFKKRKQEFEETAKEDRIKLLRKYGFTWDLGLMEKLYEE